MSFPSRQSIELFLAEDLGRGDATSEAIVPPGTRARGELLAKSEAVVCGLDVAHAVFSTVDPDVEWSAEQDEGSLIESGRTIARISGDARSILSAERTALNLLQRMCGIATATRRYVAAVEGTGCRILDTRKTAPGLRVLDKRAVVAGGGKNHRFGLDDGILIKDNHRAIAGSVREAVARARRSGPAFLKIEVEVESDAQLREALASGADAVLFDNRSPKELAALVSLARSLRPEVSLEASGGITLENVRSYAETGVNSISIGALTHSVTAADISLELALD